MTEQEVKIPQPPLPSDDIPDTNAYSIGIRSRDTPKEDRVALAWDRMQNLLEVYQDTFIQNQNRIKELEEEIKELEERADDPHWVWVD